MRVIDDTGDSGIDTAKRGYQVAHVHIVRAVMEREALMGRGHVLSDIAIRNDAPEEIMQRTPAQSGCEAFSLLPNRDEIQPPLGFWVEFLQPERTGWLDHDFICFHWFCSIPDERGLLAQLQDLLGIQDAVKLDQFGHEPRPAGLMAGAESCTIVPVKVLVKEDVIAPVGIALELLATAIDRPPAMLVAGEYPGEPAGNLFAHLEEVHHLP